MSERIREQTPGSKGLRKLADKLYGGIDMTWPKVIIFAVATAVISAVFLIAPIFDRSSFREMGTTFEAWIFFAVIIMSNCRSPLDSALKTFVFFVVSQPLIYLFQVPFSYMGWGLFAYYKNWILWTALTFPMAFAGWYLRKGNWLSLLILTPVNLLLALTGYSFLTTKLICDFPSHLISVLFCFGQIALYLWVFFRGWKPRAAGAAAVAAAIILAAVLTPEADIGVNMPLPDDPVLSDSATAALDDESMGEVSLTVSDGEGYLRLRMNTLGEVGLTVTDGDRVYRYTAEAVRENGAAFIRVEPSEE